MSIASTCGTGNLSKLQELSILPSIRTAKQVLVQLQVSKTDFTKHHCSHNALGQRALWMFVDWSHATNYDNSI